MRARISSSGTPRFSSPKAISSRTVKRAPVIWLNGLAKTRPTCPAMAASDAAGTSTPATSTWPVSLPR